MNGNGNGTRHPDEILAEIERTRREMDSTLGAIEERLTPGQLLDQGMSYLKQSGAADYARNLGTSVSSHPLPIALVGIGLAWLAAADRMDRTRGTTYPRSHGATSQWKEEAAHMKDEASGMLQQSKGSAQGKLSSMQERASEKMSSVQERASGAMSSMQERASGAMASGRQRLDETSRMAREQMGRMGEQMRGTYDRIVNEQPLALGAIGLAIGAVLAAALPRSRKEDELLAGTREKVADKASELARQASEKGKEALEKGKEAVKQQAEHAKQSAQSSAGQGSQAGKSPGATGGQQAQGPQQQRPQTPATGPQLGAGRPPTTR